MPTPLDCLHLWPAFCGGLLLGEMVRPLSKNWTPFFIRRRLEASSAWVIQRSRGPALTCFGSQLHFLLTKVCVSPNWNIMAICGCLIGNDRAGDLYTRQVYRCVPKASRNQRWCSPPCWNTASGRVCPNPRWNGGSLSGIFSRAQALAHGEPMSGPDPVCRPLPLPVVIRFGGPFR